MSYTPGPWTIQYSTNAYEGNLIYANRAIAATITEETSETTPEDKANARLIASGPDLLEAAIHALEVLQDRDWSGIGHLRSQLEAAIAKATTGQEEEL
jgi:hypothetical protein